MFGELVATEFVTLHIFSTWNAFIWSHPAMVQCRLSGTPRDLMKYLFQKDMAEWEAAGKEKRLLEWFEVNTLGGWTFVRDRREPGRMTSISDLVWGKGLIYLYPILGHRYIESSSSLSIQEVGGWTCKLWMIRFNMREFADQSGGVCVYEDPPHSVEWATWIS